MTQKSYVGIFLSFLRKERIRFWSSIFFILFVGLVVVWEYHPFEQPIRGNGVYFMYMGQSICRGDPIYRVTACGYPPMVPLINAACMSIGHMVSVPSYRSPKLFACIILVGSFLLMFLVTRIYTGKIWVGILAALILMDFPDLLKRGTASVEPKIVLLFFTLAAVYFMQKHKWIFCGLMMGMAATCYQPAIFSGLALALVAYYNQKKGGKYTLFFFASGFALGLVPSIIYLLFSGQFFDFFNSAVSLKLVTKPQIQKVGFFSFFYVFSQAIKGSLLPYLQIFIISFLMNLSMLSFRRGKNQETGLFSPRFGGITFLVFGWMIFIYLSVRIQLKFLGKGDLMPFYFLIAFWSAWGIFIVYGFFSRLVKCWPNVYPIFRFSASILFLMIVSFMTVSVIHRSVIFQTHLTLVDQIKFTEKVFADVEDSQPILALGVPEIYVLTERKNPWRYFNLWQFRYFDTIIEKLEPEGCNTLLQDIHQKKFPLIVVGRRIRDRIKGKMSGCFGRIIASVEKMYYETPYRRYQVYRLEE